MLFIIIIQLWSVARMYGFNTPYHWETFIMVSFGLSDTKKKEHNIGVNKFYDLSLFNSTVT